MIKTAIQAGTKRALLFRPYIKLMVINVMVLTASLITGFVDNILISRFLGSTALSAVGYFSPIASFSGFAVAVVTGTVIICGGFIGSGKQNQVNVMFISSFITISVLAFVFSFSLYVFRVPLSVLLGAEGTAAILLQNYVKGYAFSVLFSSLSSLLIALAAYNNDIKRSYLATGVMFVSNFLLDTFLVRPLGIYGIGIASLISTLLSFLIMIPAYIDPAKTVHFERAPFDVGLAMRAIRLGLPNLLITCAFFVKNSLTNVAVIQAAGAEGIAVANVMVSVAGIAGALSGGCTNAFQSLASVLYGEEDREAFIEAANLALWLGELFTFLLVLFMTVFSSACSAVFFSRETSTFMMCRDMFMLGFWYYLLNIPINLLLSSYRVQGKMTLVNLMAFFETAVIGVFAVVSVPVLGIKGAWLSGLFGDVISLTIILVGVFVQKKRIDLSWDALLKLPDDFGTNEEEYREFTVHSNEEVSAVSDAIVKFCRTRVNESKRAFWAGLCVEEITCNILEHGFYKGGHNTIDIRIVCKDSLAIRIHDDCKKFDPREYMKLFDGSSPEKAIGLRMVAGVAKSIDYYNNAGINTLLIKV